MKKKIITIKINKSPKLKKKYKYQIKKTNLNNKYKNKKKVLKNITLFKSNSIKNLVNIKNLNDWKKKNGLVKKDKVFIIKAKLDDLRISLNKRGWIENPNIYSNCFNFKWYSNGYNKDEMDNLYNYQIINRFEDSYFLTKKSELINTLENNIWNDSVDIENFLPETFIITKTNEKNLNNLKKLFIKYKIKSNLYNYYKKLIKNDINHFEKYFLFLNIFIFLKYYLEIEILYYFPKFELFPLQEDEFILNNIINNNLIKYFKNIQISESFFNKFEIFNNLFSIINFDDNSFENFILNNLNYFFKFNCLTGNKNIWILKPGGLSRGRGIEIKNNLEEILSFLDLNKETEYIIQKYIEKPFIIFKRKFDIRIWVLITSFDPLVVWSFEEYYLKFCSEEYDDLNLYNKFVHLTNNSINKFSKKKECAEIKGNMWFKKDFRSYINHKYNNTEVFLELEKKINFLIVTTMKSAKNNIIHRKNSYEIFGLDIMIDEKLNPWLIEVNLSPSMDKNTHVTNKLIPILCEDIVKVLIDNKSRPISKIGNFNLLYKEKIHTLNKHFNITNFYIEAKKLKKYEYI